MQVQADGMLKVSGEEPAFCIRQMRQRWILFSMHHGIQVWKRMYYNLTSGIKQNQIFAIIFTAIMLKTSIVQPHR